MPYWITNGNADCNGWAVIDTAGEAFGCHQTKQDAIDQAVAISLADDEPYMGEWKANGEDRKADGPQVIVSDIDDTLIRNGTELIQKTWDYLQSLSGELFIVTGRPESERAKTVSMLHNAGVTFSRLIMNPGSTADSAEYKKETMVKLLETYDVVEAVENDAATRRKYEELGVKATNPADIATIKEDNSRSGLVSKFETRVSAADFEVRETADGMQFEGYASVFNSRSENLGGFTEFVAPGAFTRSLKSRNDVKLLWNHDSGSVLGSTRAKSMSLVEDERGLKVTATLPNTSLGRDTAELLRTGLVDSMSFGFNVIKDSWNGDGNERTLHAVRLHEVSIVAFPAYAGTAGTTSVRSLEALVMRTEVDADKLEEAISKLEAGQDLDEDSRDLLNSVVAKLSPQAEFAPEPEPTVIGDLGLLALKKKKLEVMGL